MSEEKKIPEKKVYSVSKMLSNFREALIALVPIFNKSNIKWDSIGKYDDFDGIVESLYQWMVINKLQEFAQQKFDDEYTLPKYGYNYKDFSKRSFIQVVGADDKSDFILIFNHFITKDAPFDSINCVKIDDKGNVLGKDIELPYDGRDFHCHFRN